MNLLDVQDSTELIQRIRNSGYGLKRNYSSRKIPELNGGIPVKKFKQLNLKGFELDEIEYRIYNKT